MTQQIKDLLTSSNISFREHGTELITHCILMNVTQTVVEMKLTYTLRPLRVNISVISAAKKVASKACVKH